MALGTARNTGTHFRYDADDNLWHGKVFVKVVTEATERVKEFVAAFATLIELLSWISGILDSFANTPGMTVLGHPDGDILVGRKVDFVPA